MVTPPAADLGRASPSLTEQDICLGSICGSCQPHTIITPYHWPEGLQLDKKRKKMKINKSRPLNKKKGVLVSNDQRGSRQVLHWPNLGLEGRAVQQGSTNPEWRGSTVKWCICHSPEQYSKLPLIKYDGHPHIQATLQHPIESKSTPEMRPPL